MPFDKAVEINPAVPLERGRVYPYVDMQSVDPNSRKVYAQEYRKFTGSGSRFAVGDTLMARITPCLENGKIARFASEDNVQFGHGSTEFIVIRGRSGITDNDFVYYLTRWDGVRLYAISQMTGSSGRQRVPIASLSCLNVPIPPLPEQRAIAHILGTLDDKIELNRRMNETLEAIARTIFKSWFVDFDPVIDNALKAGKPIPGELEEKAARRREVLTRAQAEGRPAGLPEHLARLFPDEFEESGLGWIPKGWRIGQLAEILREVVSGSRPKGGAVEAGVPSIGAENVLGLGKYDYSKEKYIPREFFEKLKRKGAAVRDGDVLLYKDGAQLGRKTYFSGGFPYRECAVNEHVFILRCHEHWMQRFLFFWLDQDWMTREIIALNSNSAQPGINKRGIQSLPILIPESVTVKAFDEVVQPIVDKIFANCHESRTLAAIRDTLLPKLISGELRVKN